MLKLQDCISEVWNRSESGEHKQLLRYFSVALQREYALGKYAKVKGIETFVEGNEATLRFYYTVITEPTIENFLVISKKYKGNLRMFVDKLLCAELKLPLSAIQQPKV